MKNLTYVIDTSDSRMFYVLRYLSNLNFNCQSLSSFMDKTSVIYCFSPAKKLTPTELMELNDGSIIMCGNLPLQCVNILDSKNIKYHNLLLDEVFSVENAIQTAEAALMLIIRATSISIFNMRLIIFGYGRLGRALAKIFSGLGLNFAICTNDYYERASAHISCKDVYDLNAPIEDADVIVNTIPAKIFSSERLRSATKCTYILDLASFTSVDSCDLESLSLTYDNALGLPGKYSPKSAGEILAKAILNIKGDV